MKISECFVSINGECCSMHQGSLCTFLRTWGCFKEGCTFCDAPQSKEPFPYVEMSIEEVFNVIETYGCCNVTITGGEPFIQLDEVCELANLLHSKRYAVSIETSGAIDLPMTTASLVVDYKLPSSGMHHKMQLKHNFWNYPYTKGDFIKFVVSDKKDFEIAKSVIKHMFVKNMCASNVKFAFSPNHGVLSDKELLDWMMKEDLLKQYGAILNKQIHKEIGAR